MKFKSTPKAAVKSVDATIGPHTHPHTHCWHSVVPINNEGTVTGSWVCCLCDEKFSGREKDRPIQIHGPYAPV